MKLSISDAKLILESPKRLFRIGPWRAATNRVGCSVAHNFSARVQIDGTLPQGLWFRASKILDRPDTGTFQLDCEQTGTRTHLPLYRMEWRPFRPHENGQYGPDELQGMWLDAGITHEHVCLYHADEKTGLIRSGGVQTAKPIVPDFQSFGDSLSYVCARLNITNGNEIPPPVAQGELL